MGRFLGTILVALATLFALSACQSKFNDKAPASASIDASSTEAKLHANEELDRKLIKLENFTDRIRQILHGLRRVKKARVDQDVYTQLDFMMDMNAQLRKTAAEKRPDGWVKIAKMKLNLKGLSPACKNMEAMIRAQEESLHYYVKTCKSGDNFMEVLTGNMAQNKLKLKFLNENIVNALEDTIVPSIKASTNCEITTDYSDIVTRASCAGLTTKINASEALSINTLTFDRKSDLIFQFEADVLENGAVKGKAWFKVDSNGKPDFGLENSN